MKPTLFNCLRCDYSEERTTWIKRCPKCKAEFIKYVEYIT